MTAGPISCPQYDFPRRSGYEWHGLVDHGNYSDFTDVGPRFYLVYRNRLISVIVRARNPEKQINDVLLYLPIESEKIIPLQERASEQAVRINIARAMLPPLDEQALIAV